MVGGFLATAKIMLSQAEKRDNRISEEREADRNERLKLAEAISHMADNSAKQTQATSTGFANLVESNDRIGNEAKERNGHLAEMIVKQGEATQLIANNATKAIIKGVKNVSEQHVEHQHIDNVTVGEDNKSK